MAKKSKSDKRTQSFWCNDSQAEMFKRIIKAPVSHVALIHSLLTWSPEQVAYIQGWSDRGGVVKVKQ